MEQSPPSTLKPQKCLFNFPVFIAQGNIYSRFHFLAGEGCFLNTRRHVVDIREKRGDGISLTALRRFSELCDNDGSLCHRDVAEDRILLSPHLAPAALS